MDDVIKRSFWFSSHGFNLLLLSWISLFACVLTVVFIVCLVLDPLSITIVDYLLIKLCLDLRPKV